MQVIANQLEGHFWRQVGAWRNSIAASPRGKGDLTLLTPSSNYGVSVTGVSLPDVTLLLGVSAVAVTFELAVTDPPDEDELTFGGGGGAQPIVKVTTSAAAAARRIKATVFTERNLRGKVVKMWFVR